ncbi:hypothetical protein [Hyalangium versicolor]|uniref:hypothetical protein n=1 Tax=Hyalangium versicolor TaxID=2861190 RepID=UPI001CCF5422|nr:hypothetical protein [Hyalangium versicolor]
MKILSKKGRAVLLGSILSMWASGCDSTATGTEDPSTTEDPVTEGTPTSQPDRGGIGMLPPPPPQQQQSPPPPPQDPPPPPPPQDPPPPPPPVTSGVDPQRSLAVTDDAILSKFTLQTVMDQLVGTSGVPTTALDLFHQWWDTERPAPGLGAGPHCDSPGIANMNGFPYPCRPAEGGQALVDPFINATTNPNAYLPVGLFNRFDLAPANGANCGEYRIVFAKRSGITNPRDRLFVIFEAVLPNPTPALGLEGCRPVANFWAGLTADADVNSRGDKLHDFYFLGLPGFMPVFHVDNLGNRASNTGQVRINQFMQPTWNLREFKIRKNCGAGACTVQFTPVTVKTNPGGILFNPGSTHARTADFQNVVFPDQVASLAVNDINRFGLSIPDAFNSGQSDEQNPQENHYVNQFGAGPSPLRANIQNKLSAIGSTLTPDQVVARAMALSCAGCHRLSNGANLGSGIIWPPSLGFTHTSELTDPGPDGPRHRLSPALVGTFLPHRKEVLDTFLSAACGDNVCDSWETQATCSADCQ